MKVLCVCGVCVGVRVCVRVCMYSVCGLGIQLLL